MFAQTTPAAAELRITGAVSNPLILTAADLKKMPRKTLSVMNPHDKKKETYEGVLLEDLLTKAGVPQGEQLRGASMAAYLIAEATDNYRVVFSLAELDSGILESEVIVADTVGRRSAVRPARTISPCSPTRKAASTLGQNAQIHHGRARSGPIDGFSASLQIRLTGLMHLLV